MSQNPYIFLILFFYHIFNDSSSSKKILASESVSFISLGENQWMSQSNGSLFLSDNIQVVIILHIVSNILLFSNYCLVDNKL